MNLKTLLVYVIFIAAELNACAEGLTASDSKKTREMETNQTNAMQNLEIQNIETRERTEEARKRHDAARKAHQIEEFERVAVTAILSQSVEKSKLLFELGALIKLSETAVSFSQHRYAKSFLDDAIRCYQNYPTEKYSSYGGYTTALIRLVLQLSENGLDERFDKVARRSELSCTDEQFRTRRDRAFMSSFSPAMKERVVARLIEIRKELSSKTGLSCESLESELLNLTRKNPYSPRTFSHNRTSEDAPDLAEQFESIRKSIDTISKFASIIESSDDLNSSELEVINAYNEGPSSFQKLILNTRYISIARVYLAKQSTDAKTSLYAQRADKALRNAIDTITDTGLSGSKIRPTMEKLRDYYKSVQKLTEAESIYRYALKVVAAKVTPEAVRFTSTLRTDTAELILERASLVPTQDEANELCDEAADLFKGPEIPDAQKDSFNLLRNSYLLRRTLDKYPAIKDLDIPKGPIIFDRETGAALQGSIHAYADGRPIALGSNSDISVIGNGTGYFKILLDGETFAEKALKRIELKDLEEADKLLVLALRAEPSASNFALLSECWLMEGKVSQAYQAASIALDLDQNNAHAAALLILAQRKQGTQTDITSKVARLAKFDLDDSKLDAFDSALLKLALGKNKEAERAFIKLTPKKSPAYRTKFFSGIARSNK